MSRADGPDQAMQGLFSYTLAGAFPLPAPNLCLLIFQRGAAFSGFATAYP
jgi:hypothetical protein